MANSSETRASEMGASETGPSDWMARAAGGSATSATSRPGWMAALGLSAEASADGFCEVSPFGGRPKEPEPEEPPEPDTPEPLSPQEEAYMRGFAEGHAEAKRVGDADLALEQTRYRDLRLVFRAMDEAAMDALVHDLNATVLALCEPVLKDYALDAAALTQRCQDAARRLGAGPRDLTLHLHPETRARMDPAAFAGWTIEDDATLAPGAVCLVGLDGSVRDGPEDWMRAFAETLSS